MFQLLSEIGCNGHVAADDTVGQLFIKVCTRHGRNHPEIRGALEALCKKNRFRAVVVKQQADPDLARIQIDAVAEDEKHDHRQDEGDDVAAGIAQDLQAFLVTKRPKTPR